MLIYLCISIFTLKHAWNSVPFCLALMLCFFFVNLIVLNYRKNIGKMFKLRNFMIFRKLFEKSLKYLNLNWKNWICLQFFVEKCKIYLILNIVLLNIRWKYDFVQWFPIFHTILEYGHLSVVYVLLLSFKVLTTLYFS